MPVGQFVDWRQVELVLLADNSPCGTATLLRPAAWVEDEGAVIGQTIFLNLPEIGIEGPAEVVSIETVAVKPGLGRLVTGIFRHQLGSILELKIEGENQPLGTTKSHPFWSVDREDWIAAQDLQPGELLLDDRNQPVRLQSITERQEPQEVYNLEIDGDHCYRVGKQGLLVHNASTSEPLLDPCGCLPVVEFSLSGKHKAVAMHIRDAQASGYPKVLTYSPDKITVNTRRTGACPPNTCSNSPPPNTSCDEYPFASTREGGNGASVRCVPRGANSSQGGVLSNFYGKKVKPGDKFCVVVTP